MTHQQTSNPEGDDLAATDNINLNDTSFTSPNNNRSSSPVQSVASSSTNISQTASLIEAFKAPSKPVLRLLKRLRNVLIFLTVFVAMFYATGALLLLVRLVDSSYTVEIYHVPVESLLNPFLFTFVVTGLSIAAGLKAIISRDMHWLNIHYYVSIVDVSIQAVLLAGALVYNIILFGAITWTLVLYVIPIVGIAVRAADSYFATRLYNLMLEEHKTYLSTRMLSTVL